MKKYLKTIILSGILAVAGTIGPAAADNIKIGFNVPLTGFAAADGQSALHGAELAVAQVNGSGGVNGSMLELVVYDVGHVAPHLLWSSCDAVDAAVAAAH